MLLPLLLIASLFAACGGQDPQPPKADPALWDYLKGAASKEQQFAFKDNVITFEEYEKAILRAAECMTEAGIQNAPAVENGYIYAFNSRIPDGPDVDRMFEAHASCQDRYSREIHDAWMAQHSPTQEEVQTAFAGFTACLRSGGVDVPDAPTASEQESIRKDHGDLYRLCTQKIQDEHSMPFFGGW